MNKTLKPENFIYWLQGFFEISGATSLNEKQVTVIKEHLELCFEKVKFNEQQIPVIPQLPSVPPYNPPFQPHLQPQPTYPSQSPFWTITQTIADSPCTDSVPLTTIC